MLSHQLSLWDNEALEKGSRCLNDLKFADALFHLNEHLQSGISEQDFVIKLIEACQYWQIRIEYLPETFDDIGGRENTDSLLTDFTQFQFTPQMNLFRDALLIHIVSLLKNDPEMELKCVEIAFDQLTALGLYQEAEDLVFAGLDQHVHNRLLLYLQAQVKWLNGNKMEANMSYLWLLLHYPHRVEFNRIENKRLLDLIDNYGPMMAPAYGWLHNVAPLISIPEEIQTYSDEHYKAIQCYQLLISANKTLLTGDKSLILQSRKQLKALSPELFSEYFEWLRRGM